jgi:cysteine desulfurase
MRPIDLDANATVPLLDEARRAIMSALDLANPSSPHSRGRSARRVLDEARDHVATALGGRSKDVIFFSGASEANRWLADASQHLRTWCSSLEHPSLAKPLSSREKVDVSLAEIIFCTAAHNETGIIPDLPLDTNAILCVDAAQAVARLPVLPERVDAIVCSAHKIGGPPGAGALLLRGRAREKLFARPGAAAGKRAAFAQAPKRSPFTQALARRQRSSRERAQSTPRSRHFAIASRQRSFPHGARQSSAKIARVCPTRRR